MVYDRQPGSGGIGIMAGITMLHRLQLETKTLIDYRVNYDTRVSSVEISRIQKVIYYIMCGNDCEVVYQHDQLLEKDF